MPFISLAFRFWLKSSVQQRIYRQLWMSPFTSTTSTTIRPCSNKKCTSLKFRRTSPPDSASYRFALLLLLLMLCALSSKSKRWTNERSSIPLSTEHCCLANRQAEICLLNCDGIGVCFIWIRSQAKCVIFVWRRYRWRLPLLVRLLRLQTRLSIIKFYNLRF